MCPSMREAASEWDALAVANAMPLMSPGWVIPWWQHLAPPSAQPRVVVVRDGSELIGLAPFYVDAPFMAGGSTTGCRGSRWAGGCPRWRARAGSGRLRARSRGRSRGLPRGRTSSPWRRGRWRLRGWRRCATDGRARSGRPRGSTRRTHAQSYMLHQDSFDSWFAGRSAKFRSSMGRLGRRFDEAGGSSRMSSAETLTADIATFMRLHFARWEGRGQSGLARSWRASSSDARGRRPNAACSRSRFRLWVAEVDGEPISADLYVAAGGEVLGMNGGWSESCRKLSPPLLATMRTIKDAFERGDRRLDLGLGDQSHKTRFANGNDPVGVEHSHARRATVCRSRRCARRQCSQANRRAPPPSACCRLSR